MFRSRLCRMSLAAAAATASIGAAAVTAAAGSASASSAAALSVKCTTLTGNSGTTVMLSGCSGNTGGASKALPITALVSGGTIKWKNLKTTKVGAPAITPGTLCPAGDTDDIAKSKILADTTHSVTVGSTTNIEVCIDGSGNLSLAPGTKAKI